METVTGMLIFNFVQRFKKILVANRGEIACRVSADIKFNDTEAECSV